MNAKDSYIFSTKNNSVFVIFMLEILMNRSLTMLLILNNWALKYIFKTFYEHPLQKKYLKAQSLTFLASCSGE